MFGKILLVAVAVAVAAIAGPEIIGAAGHLLGSAAAGAVVGGAATGALASGISQGVGIATGIQDKFSWSAVGLAAVAGGIGGGLGPKGIFGTNGAFGGVNSPVLQGALRGAAGNVLGQGISVATGLQNKFDWAGVAVGAAVGGASRSVFNQSAAQAGNYGQKLVSGMAGAIGGGGQRVASLQEQISVITFSLLFPM